jgi:hypothetical protein
LGEVYNITEIKINKHFNTFTDLELLELEVPTLHLVTGCVIIIITILERA